MRYFWWIAIAMCVVGLGLGVVAAVFRLDPLLVLIGAMLAISGGVKIVMLRMWRNLPPGHRVQLPLPWRR